VRQTADETAGLFPATLRAPEEEHPFALRADRVLACLRQPRVKVRRKVSHDEICSRRLFSTTYRIGSAFVLSIIFSRAT
jgi:hypothetical protein